MQSIVNGRHSKVSSAVVVALLAFGFAAAPAAWAGRGSEKSAGQGIEVVGRVDLSGSSVTRMALVEKDRKQYLYISLSTSNELSVVDVTNWKKPRIVERTAISTPAATSELLPLGDTLAMILTTPEGSTTSQASGTESQVVTILSVEDPANPTVARVFQGVTSLVTDDGRGLIYVANAKGLWIIKAEDKTQAAPALAEEQEN
jgi:hypothetical protein